MTYKSISFNFSGIWFISEPSFVLSSSFVGKSTFFSSVFGVSSFFPSVFGVSSFFSPPTFLFCLISLLACSLFFLSSSSFISLNFSSSSSFSLLSSSSFCSFGCKWQIPFSSILGINRLIYFKLGRSTKVELGNNFGIAEFWLKKSSNNISS